MYPQNIKITTDAIVFSKTGPHLQILLVKRKNDPFKGLWSFPGGFVEDNEDIEAGAIRELEEETAIKLPTMKQLHTFGKPGRDPRGRTVSVAHYAIVQAKDHAPKGGDDAAEAQWTNVSDITALAFDHKEILDFALRALAEQLG
jgi:8-oxo-dGTP diphosphatase